MTLAPVNPDQNVNRAANRICRAIALHSRSCEAGSEATGSPDARQRQLFMRMELFFIDLQIDRCGACTIRRFADLMAPRIRRVALIYDARRVYDLKVMMGVASYIRERPQFSVYIEENALKDQRLPDLRSWQGDGIIADFDDPAIARLVQQARLPAVGFGGGDGWCAGRVSGACFSTHHPD